MIKLLDLLENRILVPRRSKEERQENYQIAIQKKIQQYIKGGNKGNLDLFNAPITSLPDNLEVGGHLNLENTSVQSLPNGLKVGGSLVLFSTPIKSLPNDLEVKGSLFLKGTPLSKKYNEEEIKAIVPGVEGDIYI